MPKLKYIETEKYSLVNITAPGIPGLECEIWCYEDQLGKAASHHKEEETLVLIHRLETATVTSRFEPVSDGIDIRVEVTGPDAAHIRAIKALNPCWQLRNSETFGNRGDYVQDFVARCFVILESGPTRLKDTQRIPGTRGRPNDRADLPEPWIQEYFPTWRPHPGQIPGQRGYSPDRPVYPLIGCLSREDKYLVAFAWPEARSLGQVWHDCLHPRPAIVESYDPETNRTVSRGKLYFLPNDEKQLLDAFKRDFPEWTRPNPAEQHV